MLNCTAELVGKNTETCGGNGDIDTFEAFMVHDETIEGFLTVNELAKQLKVGRKQIYKLIDAGALAAIRLGPRLYRIPVAAARQLLIDLRVASPRT